ncbi:MAG: PBP1A family penicillin-binding protein [Acidobacteria bacterium]|nr:PBP1A family penicillin-binding protein [Acidobacteriota bacterium]
MAVKVKIGGNSRTGAQHSLGVRILRVALIACSALLLLFFSVFGYYYFKYQKIVDDRLNAGPMFTNTSQIFAAPREVRPGQKLSAGAIGQELRQAGYNNNPQMGTYQLRGDTILIKPGPQSFHSTDGATITTEDGEVQSITAENGVALRGYELEPLLITGLSEDKNRIKRRLVSYKDIPQRMVQSVTAIEDRQFFEHGGINYARTIKCGVQDVLSGRKACGGSTLTQQLARGFFLTPEKHIKRKLIEILISFQLEARFSKQQIFEMYANQINLGQRGSFAINGFGEAAQAYFGKDLKQLDLAECAMLAGMIQRPNYFSPYKHPERAMERRNIVLDSMVETNAITKSEAERAKAEPIRLAPPNVDASEAPYFVDVVHDNLVQRIGDQELSHQSLRIYTSLDPDLQRAASEAVAIGMQNVDEMVRKQHRGNGPITWPQVSLVALNPHTGQVLAMVGGRNYGVSQLNHATSKRPTGSIFKPFVYAAAYNASVNGQTIGDKGIFTATTMLDDEPTTFTFDNGRQTYTPRNYKDEFHGSVTAIYALAHSLNNATISLGQMVGFENVAALGRQAGIAAARGTPAVSLGAYDATPLDMAGAYTIFANNGVHLNPWTLASVRNLNGDIVADFAPEARQVLDPRVAALSTSLMEGVMNFGYGYETRKRGFMAPAAGKTGTSHDAWFAGYTSNLICIVWVGNDDYTDVKLAGALAAAPIWAEFMNRAIKLPQYSDMKPFSYPDGVVLERLDKTTNLLSDSSCPNAYSAAFLAGTEPHNTCSHMGDDQRNFFQKMLGIGGQTQSQENQQPPSGNEPGASPNPAAVRSGPPPNPGAQPSPGSSPNPVVEEPKKKKNFFQKIFGGGGDKKQQQPQPPPQ